MTDPQITIERLHSYNSEDAAAIGKLLPLLSSRFADEPLGEELFKEIVASPYHDIIAARNTSQRIVGMVIMSLTIGIGDGHEAFLDDFVVSSEVQGQGIGSRIWREAMKWCREKDVKELLFTSRPEKTAAHKFYLSHGAIVHPSTVYKVKDFSKE